MEIWLGTCNIFVLTMCLGIILIHWIGRFGCFKINQQMLDGLPMVPISHPMSTFAGVDEECLTFEHSGVQLRKTWLVRVNFAVGLIFAFAFTLFNVFYWIHVE